MQSEIDSDERILPKRTVLDRVGVNHVTLWRMERRGEFPRHVQISFGRVGYLEREVRQWIASKAGAR
jgi:prophage regulatory protein